MSKERTFVELTTDALNINDNNKNRLASRGFEIDDDDKKQEDCVLIMGLNPSGNENDADRDKKEDIPYLCYIEKAKIDNWTNPSYFKPIYDFVQSIEDSVQSIEDSVKWPWHNISKKKLLKKIRNLNKNDKDTIREDWDKHQNSKTTIYIGDMFYYHQTNSTEFKKLIKCKNYKNYCEEMLEEHINCLNNHNKTIKFIYIANAKVSHWLTHNEPSITTFSKIKPNNIPIFYGGMLSGQGAIDDFSKRRLINEITNYLKNNQ